MRQTDGHSVSIRCSSLTLKHKEYLKSTTLPSFMKTGHLVQKMKVANDIDSNIRISKTYFLSLRKGSRLCRVWMRLVNDDHAWAGPTNPWGYVCMSILQSLHHLCVLFTYILIIDRDWNIWKMSDIFRNQNLMCSLKSQKYWYGGYLDKWRRD
jgi:hypothetical protein